MKLSQQILRPLVIIFCILFTANLLAKVAMEFRILLPVDILTIPARISLIFLQPIFVLAPSLLFKMQLIPYPHYFDYFNNIENEFFVAVFVYGIMFLLSWWLYRYLKNRDTRGVVS